MQVGIYNNGPVFPRTLGRVGTFLDLTNCAMRAFIAQNANGLGADGCANPDWGVLVTQSSNCLLDLGSLWYGTLLGRTCACIACKLRIAFF